MTEQEKYDAWREVDKEFLRNTAADMVEDYFDGMCREDILGESYLGSSIHQSL